MHLACLFDLFCPLLETVVCLFGGKEVLLIWGGNGVFRVSFGFGFFFLFNISSESFADSDYDY